MRTLKLIEHISLDGVIQNSSEGGFAHGDWTGPYRGSPAGMARMLAEYGEGFDVLLGRRTYDMWSGFWPKAPKSPMADGLNAATKHVVTHRPESLEWGPFEGVVDLLAGVRAIKARAGGNLIVAGSSTLTSALLEHGLVDEVILVTYPVLLGSGKRLFADGTPPRALRLESTTPFPSGLVVNSYKAAGPLLNLK